MRAFWSLLSFWAEFCVMKSKDVCCSRMCCDDGVVFVAGDNGVEKVAICRDLREHAMRE